MCLDVITKRYKRPTRTQVVAFKGLRLVKGELHFPCQYHHGSEIIPLGRWIKAESRPIGTNGTEEEYESGFHVYADSNPRSPYGNRLVKVKVRGVTCKGMQDWENVLVAQEMFVPKPRKPRKGK